MCNWVGDYENHGNEKLAANKDYAQLIAWAKDTLHNLCLAIDSSIHPLQMTLVNFYKFVYFFTIEAVHNYAHGDIYIYIRSIVLKTDFYIPLINIHYTLICRGTLSPQ